MLTRLKNLIVRKCCEFGIRRDQPPRRNYFDVSWWLPLCRQHRLRPPPRPIWCDDGSYWTDADIVRYRGRILLWRIRLLEKWKS